MPVVSAVMVPHPPIIIPDIGRGEEWKIAATTAAYEAAAQFIRDSEPETLVITTPHSEFHPDRFHISPGKSAKGSFASFGASNVKLSADYDTELVLALRSAALDLKLPAETEPERDSALDHGTMVPLWFINRAYKSGKLPRVVRIGLSGRSLADHYRLGMLLTEVSDKLGRRTAVIASGDLSHKLKKDGPYGFTPEGPQYDDRLMNAMADADFGELLSFGDSFCQMAGECGHRSFTIMAGALDRRAVKAEKLSYEGPFGVGYGVCTFAPGPIDPSRCYLECASNRDPVRGQPVKNNEYIKLARLAVESFVMTGKRADIPGDLPAELTERRAGVFVTLHLRGRLRGCIGTIEPTTESVAAEIIQNGISSCSRDPRFPPVKSEELGMLEYSVDVMGEPEPIDSADQLDVKRYGVIVESGFRRGLLLPSLEGVDTKKEQVQIARQKAGISPDEPVKLYRFEVTRHE